MFYLIRLRQIISAIKTSIPTGTAITKKIANEKNMTSESPVDPALLTWAEYWYPVSWKLLAGAGILTAASAFATVGFFILQWRTTAIRERQADWKTAQLEYAAAQAKLEQEKLKQLLAWRTLSDAETRALTDALKETPEAVSRWVSLQYVLNDSESLYLAQQITRVLEATGWNVTWHACTWINSPMVGLHIPGENDVTLALRNAFSKAKIDFSPNPVESPNSFTTMGPRPSATETVRYGYIVVGSKAPPFRAVNDSIKAN